MPPSKPLKNIAIVGIAARFSEATNAESLWELINGTTHTSKKVSGDHFDIDAVYDPNPDAPNTYCSRASKVR